jgi:hypothetical protein
VTGHSVLSARPGLSVSGTGPSTTSSTVCCCLYGVFKLGFSESLRIIETFECFNLWQSRSLTQTQAEAAAVPWRAQAASPVGNSDLDRHGVTAAHPIDS